MSAPATEFSIHVFDANAEGCRSNAIVRFTCMDTLENWESIQAVIPKLTTQSIVDQINNRPFAFLMAIYAAWSSAVVGEQASETIAKASQSLLEEPALPSTIKDFEQSAASFNDCTNQINSFLEILRVANNGVDSVLKEATKRTNLVHFRAIGRWVGKVVPDLQREHDAIEGMKKLAEPMDAITQSMNNLVDCWVSVQSETKHLKEYAQDVTKNPSAHKLRLRQVGKTFLAMSEYLGSFRALMISLFYETRSKMPLAQRNMFASELPNLEQNRSESAQNMIKEVLTRFEEIQKEEGRPDKNKKLSRLDSLKKQFKFL